MSEQLVYVGLFLVVFASIPLILKRFLRHSESGHSALAKSTKIVSMVGVGPNQRVVTVEVGPDNKRLLLVLGVSAQSMVCLHKFPADASIDAEVGVASHLEDAP